jgi:type IV pilus assembly protein PilN
MRVPINLASQPYENLRPFYSAAGLATVLLAVLALTVAWNVRQNRNESRRLTVQSDQLEKDMQNLNQEKRVMEQWLARPEVLEIRDRSAFLNSIIFRKSLSWTQMFMDLEKVLPDRVQVTAIHPSMNPEQQVELRLTVSSATVPSLVEFLKGLESAPQFASPVVMSQRFPAEKATDRNITLELKVPYRQTDEAPLSSAHEATKRAERKSPEEALPEAAPQPAASPAAPPAATVAPAPKPAPPAPSDASQPGAGAPVWQTGPPPVKDVIVGNQGAVGSSGAPGARQLRPRREPPLSSEEER